MLTNSLHIEETLIHRWLGPFSRRFGSLFEESAEQTSTFLLMKQTRALQYLQIKLLFCWKGHYSSWTLTHWPVCSQIDSRCWLRVRCQKNRPVKTGSEVLKVVVRSKCYLVILNKVDEKVAINFNYRICQVSFALLYTVIENHGTCVSGLQYSGSRENSQNVQKCTI